MNALSGRDAAFPGAASPEHRAVHALERVAVALRSDDRGNLQWLNEHLRPSFATDRSADVVATLDLITAPDLVDTFSQRASSAVDRLPCFALDTRVVELPAWHEGDALVIADPDLDAFYRVQAACIEVLGRPGDRRPRIGALRIVREILTAAALARAPILDLHAAAFEASHGAVLLAGARHAGKTTLLAFAASGGARPMANDRVLVHVGRSPAVAFGIPTLVAVRPGTLSFFGALRGGTTGRATLLQAGEPETTPGAIGRGENVRSLSLRGFAERLGTPPAGSAPLDAVVFPEIDVAADGWTLNVLPVSDGLSKLRTCVYGGDRPRAATVFGRLGAPAAHGGPDVVLDRWERLGRTVTFLRCRLGPEAYERPAGEWLSALRARSRRNSGPLR